MKVKDLIEKLKKLDQDAMVVIPGYEDDWDMLNSIHILNVKKRDGIIFYRGDWCETEDKRCKSAVGLGSG